MKSIMHKISPKVKNLTKSQRSQIEPITNRELSKSKNGLSQDLNQIPILQRTLGNHGFANLFQAESKTDRTYTGPISLANSAALRMISYIGRDYAKPVSGDGHQTHQQTGMIRNATGNLPAGHGVELHTSSGGIRFLQRKAKNLDHEMFFRILSSYSLSLNSCNTAFIKKNRAKKVEINYRENFGERDVLDISEAAVSSFISTKAKHKPDVTKLLRNSRATKKSDKKETSLHIMQLIFPEVSSKMEQKNFPKKSLEHLMNKKFSNPFAYGAKINSGGRHFAGKYFSKKTQANRFTAKNNNKIYSRNTSMNGKDSENSSCGFLVLDSRRNSFLSRKENPYDSSYGNPARGYLPNGTRLGKNRGSLNQNQSSIYGSQMENRSRNLNTNYTIVGHVRKAANMTGNVDPEFTKRCNNLIGLIKFYNHFDLNDLYYFYHLYILNKVEHEFSYIREHFKNHFYQNVQFPNFDFDLISEKKNVTGQMNYADNFRRMSKRKNSLP
jgi:hypothetical protein